MDARYDARWQLVQSELNLYRYTSPTPRPIKSHKPVLMLHGTFSSYLTWSLMAESLWQHGFENLYALNLEEIQSGVQVNQDAQRLEYTIDYLLAVHHGESKDLIVIGHAAGASLAYRYWQPLGDEARICYLFMLAAPHDQTIFPFLPERVVLSSTSKSPRTSATQTIVLDFNRISGLQNPSSTVLVNIMGNLPGYELFDGVVRGLRIPEAANEVIPGDRGLHRYLTQDPRVVETLLAYLRGERYLVKLKLVGVQMQRDDSRGFSGPIVFEIDGNLMPPDTLFQAITGRLYLFEERVPPLATLSYPQSAVSATVTIHLRDLSNIQGQRRRMYTRLHIPLRDQDSSTYPMQDSEGSDFLWRVTCKQTHSVDDSRIHDLKHDFVHEI